jgi:hypothetical protein
MVRPPLPACGRAESLLTFQSPVPAKQEDVCAQAAQLPSRPHPSVEGIKKMMEVYNYREMRLHRPEDFYDASLVAELDRSGYIDGLYQRGAAPR